ncbi:MAG: YecA family protein [Bacillus sp. (in: firmicutes)]
METKKVYTLPDLLGKLTIGQMQNIRRNLNLKGMSSLRKKELIEALAEKIPGTVTERLGNLTEEQFAFITKMVAEEGTITIQEEQLEDVFFYNSLGYMHSVADNTAVIPAEIMDELKKVSSGQLTDTLKKNQAVANMVAILMFHYGAVEISHAQSLIEKELGEQLDTDWFVQFLKQQSEHAGVFHLFEGYIIDELVQDEKELIAKQNASNLEYADIPLKGYKGVKYMEYLEMTPEMKALMDYLKKRYQFGQDELIELSETTHYMIQLENQLTDIIHLYNSACEFKDKDEIKAVADHLMKVMNSTKLWFMKGHSPNELSATKPNLRILNNPLAPTAPVKKSPESKVGRNEPCICGSGKKYKKCCLNA